MISVSSFCLHPHARRLGKGGGHVRYRCVPDSLSFSSTLSIFHGGKFFGNTNKSPPFLLKLAANFLSRDMLTCFGCWLYDIHASSLITELPMAYFQSQVPDVSLNRFQFWNCNLKPPLAHRACNNIQKPPSCQKSYPFYFSKSALF